MVFKTVARQAAVLRGDLSRRSPKDEGGSQRNAINVLIANWYYFVALVLFRIDSFHYLDGKLLRQIFFHAFRCIGGYRIYSKGNQACGYF